MKKLFCTIISVIFIFALHISLCFAGEVPLDIRNAADEGIRIFLKDPRITGLQRLGFDSQSDIDDAELGEGFQIFTIHTDKLIDESDLQDISSLATPTNEWQFLVVTGDNADALLTVDLIDDKWIPVSIGFSGLAKELHRILDVWPASSGYRGRLLRIYHTKSEFIEISQGENVVGIISLTSANVAMGGQINEFNPLDLHDAKEMVKGLRSSVRRAINNGQ